MQRDMQIFSSERFGSIRTIFRDGQVWFVGKDAAAALGYANTNKALRDHVDPEDRTQGDGVTIRDPMGRGQHPVIINESGLYALILSSKLPTAREFKRWITREVLPAVRQYGAYATDVTLARLLADPRQARLLVLELAREMAAADRLSAALADALPKARYYDTFVNPDGCTNLRTTAKELGIPERRFTRYLLAHRYLYRAPSGVLMPYAPYHALGYFVIRDFHKRNSPDTGHYTLITARGKAHFMGLTSQILQETM